MCGKLCAREQHCRWVERKVPHVKSILETIQVDHTAGPEEHLSASLTLTASTHLKRTPGRPSPPQSEPRRAAVTCPPSIAGSHTPITSGWASHPTSPVQCSSSPSSSEGLRRFGLRTPRCFFCAGYNCRYLPCLKIKLEADLNIYVFKHFRK